MSDLTVAELGKKIACHPKFKPRDGALHLGVGYGLRFTKRWDRDAQPFDVIEMVVIEDAATVGTVIDTLADLLVGGEAGALRMLYEHVYETKEPLGVAVAYALLVAWGS